MGERFSSWVAILSLALIAACDPTFAFDVDLEGEAEVQGDPLLGVLGGFPVFSELVSVDVAQTDEFENHDTRKEHVRQARLTLLRLSILEPEGGTFDFLSAITFFVESPAHARQQVATLDVPRGAEVIELDVADVDLAPYIRDASFSVRTDARGRRPSRDTRVKAELRFAIVAGTRAPDD